MRTEPSVLHLDMDAFYASVEQLHKPSLRGKPVVVGGVGGRGVVSTASYEARVFGVRSAMPMSEARRRCPNAAFLAPRFAAYAAVSTVVMRLLRERSALVEPLSLDEAFVDLAAPSAGAVPPLDLAAVRAIGARLRADIRAATGITASVGAGSSKSIAKIASDACKPDGLLVVPPGAEQDLLDPLPVRALWTVGPATADRLRRAGVGTVAELRRLAESDLVAMFGQAHGRGLYALATGQDDRPVVADREAKSVSVEDTFERDLVDRARLGQELDRLAERLADRLRRSGRSGRTVTVKLRRHDFTTLARSDTLAGPTDDGVLIRDTARRLLAGVEVTGGIRLLGVGVSGLADYAQGDLFASLGTPPAEATAQATFVGEAERPAAPAPSEQAGRPEPRRWAPGQDVTHPRFGPGWVQGSGLGRVTVRFETPRTAPGRVRTLDVDDADLTPAPPPRGGADG